MSTDYAESFFFRNKDLVRGCQLAEEGGDGTSVQAYSTPAVRPATLMNSAEIATHTTQAARAAFLHQILLELL